MLLVLIIVIIIIMYIEMYNIRHVVYFIKSLFFVNIAEQDGVTLAMDDVMSLHNDVKYLMIGIIRRTWHTY